MSHATGTADLWSCCMTINALCQWRSFCRTNEATDPAHFQSADKVFSQGERRFNVR